MNCPEKIANVYLRLNGFFLLPHFTLFGGGESHTHVDFLALRPSNGIEEVSVQEESSTSIRFPLDDDFFSCVRNLTGSDPLMETLGAIVEVKGNRQIERPSEVHIQYVKKFFGDNVRLVPLAFSQGFSSIKNNYNTIEISLTTAFIWIMNRIQWMDENLNRLSKSGSWCLSEDFLSDLIYIKQIYGLK